MLDSRSEKGRPTNSLSSLIPLAKGLNQRSWRLHNDLRHCPGPGPAPDRPLERVTNWSLEEDNPRPIISDDETSSVNSVPESPTAEIPERDRMSLLINSSRRLGVEMDMATKKANEMLLREKEALECAGNMKRECKQTALECLQSLYEMVLALSDSRSWHKYNLEKERTRSAQELMRLERAHTKTVTGLIKELASDLYSARKEIKNTLTEAKNIRSWLDFETQEPFRKISEIQGGLKEQEKRIKALQDLTNDDAAAKTSANLSSLQGKVETLWNNTNEMRSTLQKKREKTIAQIESSHKTLKRMEKALPSLTNDGIMSTEMAKLRKLVEEVKDQAKQQQAIDPTAASINEEVLNRIINPLQEKIEIMCSELRTLREHRNRSSDLTAVNLAKEMGIATKPEGKPKPSYARVAATPPPPKPNHTLIVSSTDPKKTGENVIDIIRETLDTKTTGARVERVRKARNQKIVLSCGSKHDLDLTKIRQNKELKAEVAKANNPLAIVRDVLAYHSDAEILQNIISQNKHLLQDIDMKTCVLRVKYRKKARNPLECHPVLELSPSVYRRLIEEGKIYIGLQRRPIFDHSPLVQCTKCLGFGHTRGVCQEKDKLCSHCGEAHKWEKCPSRLDGLPPKCKNCKESSHPSRASTWHTTPSTKTAKSGKSGMQ
ncbi:unnamed protein product, partial [Iphiclides podalirius]